MAHADVDTTENLIIVDAQLSDKDRITQIPGASWHKASNRWRLPLTWAACLQLRGVFGADLTLSDGLVSWGWDTKNALINPAMELRESMSLSGDSDVATTIDAIESSTLRLMPFQRAAVAYLVSTRQAMLAEPMGAGKTAITIRTLQALHELNEDPFPALIVCPNSLKNTVWADKLAEWAPELDVQVIDGTAAKRRKQILGDDCCLGYDVAIINYDLLKLHSRLAPFGSVKLTDKQKEPKELNQVGYKTVIFDEAHRLCHVGGKLVRNADNTSSTVPVSQQTLAAFAVAHQAQFRYVLTGTPVNDHVGDLWGLLHTIRPDWFPAKSRYLDRYAQKMFGLWGGIEILGIRPDTEPEFRAITQPLYRRLLKEILLPQLPPKLPTIYRETPMSPKQEKIYRQMEEMMIARLNDTDIVVANGEIGQFTRLLQFAAACAELDENGNVRLTGSSNKVDDLVDLIGEMGGEPLVVAAVSRQLIDLAAERLTKEKIRYGMVTGALSPYERAEHVRRFQDGQSQVMLLTLGAGAEGLTLTRARTMLFMQRSYSPLQNSQGEDRIHRIGSEIHDSVQIIEQITPHTVEERRREVLDKKEVRIEEVMQDKEALLRLLGAK